MASTSNADSQCSKYIPRRRNAIIDDNSPYNAKAQRVFTGGLLPEHHAWKMQQRKEYQRDEYGRYASSQAQYFPNEYRRFEKSSSMSSTESSGEKYVPPCNCQNV